MEANKRAGQDQLLGERATHKKALEDAQEAAQSLIDELEARADSMIAELNGKNAGSTEAWQTSSRQFVGQLLEHLGKNTGAQAPVNDDDEDNGPVILDVGDLADFLRGRTTGYR